MAKEIICGIYKITSPSGRVYIGQALDIYRRWNIYRLGCCKTQPLLRNSIQKYGWENHSKEIIEVCRIEYINEREIYWIKHFNTYRTPSGMNLTIGGEGAKGLVLSMEVRRRQSETRKGRLKGDKNGMFGRGHTLETRELQKEIWSKRRNSIEYNSSERRKKRSDSQRGNKNSEGKIPSIQVRKKISESLKKHFENKENHPFYKRHHKSETKTKLSDAIKNVWVKLKNSDEYNSDFRKKKRSEDQKKAWETRRINLQNI